MILVTGATGLLGNAVTRELVSRGQRVHVLVRATSNQRALATLPVTIFEGEISDRPSIHRAMIGCSTVIHCAAHIHLGWSQLEHSRSINVGGTRNVAVTARDLGCRMVYISSVDALPVATNPARPISETCTGRPNVPCAYVVSKREAESVVHEYSSAGLQSVVLYPGFMLGPYDWKPSSGRMFLEISKAPVVIAPGGGASVCDSRDVAQATVNVALQDLVGQRYILAGTNIRYQDLWNHMLRAMGQNRRALCFPYAVAASGPVFDAFNKILRRNNASPNGAEIAMGGLWHYYDSSKAQRELNYILRPLEETIFDAWRWLQQNHLSR